MKLREVTLGDLRRTPSLIEEVFNHHRQDMLIYCSRSFPGIAAEDIVQQVLEELCRIIQKGVQKPSVPVYKWLYMTLRRRCLDDIRMMKRRERISGSEDENITDRIPDTGKTPDETMLEQERSELIDACVEMRMSGRTREAIILLRDGLSQREIASEMGVSKARVSILIKKGILQLRKELREAGYLSDRAMVTLACPGPPVWTYRLECREGIIASWTYTGRGIEGAETTDQAKREKWIVETWDSGRVTFSSMRPLISSTGNFAIMGSGGGTGLWEAGISRGTIKGPSELTVDK